MGQRDRGLGGPRRGERRAGRADHRAGCSSAPTRGRASGCSSWPAARAAPGSRPRRVSAPTARWCCPTSSPGWPTSPGAGPRRSASPTSAPRCSTSRPSTSPTRRFDVVLCREGLMFAVDPRRGAGEIARVLRPGGRAAVAVWGPRAENPWLGIVLGRGRRAPRHDLAAAGHARALLAVRRGRARRGARRRWAGRRATPTVWPCRTRACRSSGGGPAPVPAPARSPSSWPGCPRRRADAIRGACVRGGRRAHGRRARASCPASRSSRPRGRQRRVSVPQSSSSSSGRGRRRACRGGAGGRRPPR